MKMKLKWIIRPALLLMSIALFSFNTANENSSESMFFKFWGWGDMTCTPDSVVSTQLNCSQTYYILGIPMRTINCTNYALDPNNTNCNAM